MKTLLGTKLGMTQFFNEDGTVVRCTVIQAGPCVVTQKKTVENDGYAATQIAFGDVKAKRLNKPLLGHLKKAGVGPKRHLVEVRGEDELAVGDAVTVEAFAPGDKVKVTGVSKGKGFQGVIKRHGFAGGPGYHGAHFHRAPGSIGASADPARVFPGHPAARARWAMCVSRRRVLPWSLPTRIRTWCWSKARSRGARAPWS